jgi:hypothetical protein
MIRVTMAKAAGLTHNGLFGSFPLMPLVPRESSLSISLFLISEK